MTFTNFNDAVDFFCKAWFSKLDQMSNLLKKVWNPHLDYKTIHIAGTNGKWSTSKMTYQILREAGYNVGVYTSPFLIDPRERCIVNDEMMSQEDFTEILNEINKIDPFLIYWQKATLMAFMYFKKKRVDFAVIEALMWGWRDNTNVIEPLITCITNIWFDHEDFLWHTWEEISLEKAWIIKKKIPIVINQKNHVIEWIAQEKDTPLIYTDKELETNLIWSHQKKNSALAYEIGKYIWISDSVIKKALMNVSHPWRIDYIRKNMFIDWAHNEDGIKELKKYLTTIKHDYENIYYCFSLKDGKEIDIIVDSIWEENMYILVNLEKTKSDTYERNQEKLSSSYKLEKQMQEKWIQFSSLSPEEIVDLAENNKHTLFVIFWSLYMIGAFLKFKQ